MYTADFVKTCSMLTTECMQSVVPSILPEFVKGAPSIGFESLDPLVIEHLEFTLPGNLNIEFDNGTAHGIEKCSVGSIRYIIFVFH